MELAYGTPPYIHQREDLEKTWRAIEWAYFWEQGTGKTKLIIDRSLNLYLNGLAAGTLVISMNGPHADFIKEGVTEHWKKDVPIVARVYRSGMGKKATAHFEECFTHAGNAFRMMTINYEATRTKAGMNACLRFLKALPHGVMGVADESDLIKTPSAAQTRSTQNILHRCKYRVIMTGTEITNGPLDLYAQTQALRPGILGCPNFITFKHHYAEWRERIITSGAGPARRFEELVRYRNLDEMKARLATFSSTRLKRDCTDIPEKIYLPPRTVVLGAVQRTHYDRVKERVLAEFENGTLTTEHALTRLLRLSQITGGFLPLDDLEEPWPLPNAKLDAMLHDIDQVPNDDSLIIWARFIPELNLITKTLSERGSVARYWGEIERDTRAQEAEEFKAGKRRFMVSQAQAGGRGHTWLRGTHVFYFSNSYSWSQRAQSEDRPHRIGQTEHVSYYDYAAEDTVDLKIINALRAKRNIAEFFKDRSSLKELLS